MSGETAAFVKRGGRWSLDGAGEADGALCAALAAGAQAFTVGPQASPEPGRYGAYGLADAEAARLRVFVEGSGVPVLDAYLGKPAYGEALYARLAGEAPVFLATGLPPETLLLPATSFLLKR